MDQMHESPAQLRNRLMNPQNGRRSDEIEIIPQYRVQRERTAAAALHQAQANHERKLLIAARQRRAAELMQEYQFKLTAWVLGESAEPSAPATPKLLFEQILMAVSKFYGIPRIHIISQRKTANLVRPRQAAMYLGRELTELSLPMIGSRIGGRDHTTVLHGHRKVEAALAAGDQALASEIAAIRRSLEAE